MKKISVFLLGLAVAISLTVTPGFAQEKKAPAKTEKKADGKKADEKKAADTKTAAKKDAKDAKKAAKKDAKK